MTEMWRPVPEFPCYDVSTLGRMRTNLPYRRFSPPPVEPRIVRYGSDKDGYYRVALYRGTERHRGEFRVHVLVLLVFHPSDRFPGAFGLHKNGVKTDNRLENLYWGTAKQNSDDSRRHGTYIHGERVNTCVLTEQQVRSIRASKGVSSRAELAGKYGCTVDNITAIWLGKTWRHLLEG